MTKPSTPVDQAEEIDLENQKEKREENEGHYEHQKEKREENEGHSEHQFTSSESCSPDNPEPQPQLQPQPQAKNGSSQTTFSVIRQRKERYKRLANLGLRSAGLLFSFLSFVIMAANNQNGLNFDYFEEYSYCLAISVLAFVYLAFQFGKAIYDVVVGYGFLPKTVVAYVDFIGDQVMAYLMMSASSSAASLTNRLREDGDASFTDMAAGSVSMLFLCFAVVAVSCLLSGFTLSKLIRW